MENKVLVRVIVPEFERSFDAFIPVNEVVWKLKKLLIKSVSDVIGLNLDMETPSILLNKNSNSIYTNNQIVINTDIRNGTELILILKKV